MLLQWRFIGSSSQDAGTMTIARAPLPGHYPAPGSPVGRVLRTV